MLQRFREKLQTVGSKWGLDNLLGGSEQIDEEFWEDLESLLIRGDVGLETSEKIIEKLKEESRRKKARSREDIKSALKDILKTHLESVEGMGEPVACDGAAPCIILLVGVNGSGKTTTAAKIARNLSLGGKRPILVAADTFRSAAIDQLKQLGNSLGIDVLAREPGSDPAAVVFDAIRSAKAGNADCLVVDTAGRLHTKKNLMEELRKISKIVDRECDGWKKETLLVLDAVSGQNAFAQASVFHEILNLTGVIVTKYDNTAKGGILLAVAAKLQLPVRYVGLGERAEDLTGFSPTEFAEGLLQ
ncbi:MAG TPA: signal recognition particle-docking protein FtsY [Synergistaceae bacterium]|jgi:fused signal recognition particle receptor|nr:MAG: Signal recognition particle receptor FtsY [Synergistales bacterium 53_16]KUL04947.1 MAG: Signal recognition particle receptor FtsY [Synergistales bacterium 54_9]MDN5335542.1 fused signal recognition particle receptor [Synergistales bacterium]HAA48007.1 signal recognition particle-docking protein FtsY [Synergistaceae bacterium]HAG22097.1 signal recognition particle-docking protein FtsY [Synergistaceae bacterium]